MKTAETKCQAPTAGGPQAWDPRSSEPVLGSERRVGHVSALLGLVTQGSQPREVRAQNPRLETLDQEANAALCQPSPDPPPHTCGHCFQGNQASARRREPPSHPPHTLCPPQGRSQASLSPARFLPTPWLVPPAAHQAIFPSIHPFIPRIAFC